MGDDEHELEIKKSSSLLIVDDHPLFRDALAAAASLNPNIRSTYFAGSVLEACECLKSSLPDLVLLDLNLKDTTGLESLITLQAQAPSQRVAIVTATEDREIIERAMALGAVGYIPKSLDMNSLKGAISDLLSGENWTPPEFQQAIEPSPASEIASRLASLTPAQRRVLSGLKSGLLNKQIAYEMGISEATVKAHMTAIFRKLGVASRTQALLSLQAVVAI